MPCCYVVSCVVVGVDAGVDGVGVVIGIDVVAVVR